MPHSNYVHIVDGVSQRRAAISQELVAHGLHAEIYEDIAEIAMPSFPAHGAILLSDDEDFDLDEVLRTLRESRCFLPVIAYTSQAARSRRIVETMRGGAYDYLVFPDDFAIVGDVIEGVVARAQDLTRHAEISALARSRVARLSPRERVVLLGVIDGETSKEIGRRHGISPRTVEVHRAAMLTKLSVATTAGAIATGIAAGMLQESPSSAAA